MNEYRTNFGTTSFGTVVRQPSALIPLGMALTALAVVLGHIALFGAAREADEGAAARIWQLLMLAQLPALLVFGVRWLPKAPKQAMSVLVLLVAAILAAMAPVFIFHL
jgi:cytochrome bd-type quinol oxidase subunit 2